MGNKNEIRIKIQEEVFNFIEGEELLIYLYLCRRKVTFWEKQDYKKSIKDTIKRIGNIKCVLERNRKAKGILKGALSKKIIDYARWEQYVTDKYKEFSIEKLEEFIRYLNYKNMGIKIYESSLNIILVPLIISLIGTFITNIIMNRTNDKELKLPSLYQMMEQSGDSPQIIFAWIVIVIIYILIVVALILMSCSIFIHLISSMKDVNIKRSFYEDYKTIVKNIIEEKK